MPRIIQLTAESRLVLASDFKAPGAPIDFTKDHVVILDKDSRPVAECRPLEPLGTPTRNHHAAVVKPAPATAVKFTPAPATPPRQPFENRNGRLTDSQRELLERLWKENPKSTADVIGEKFERQAGRSVSVFTVNSYKPD